MALLQRWMMRDPVTSPTLAAQPCPTRHVEPLGKTHLATSPTGRSKRRQKERAQDSQDPQDPVAVARPPVPTERVGGDGRRICRYMNHNERRQISKGTLERENPSFHSDLQCCISCWAADRSSKSPSPGALDQWARLRRPGLASPSGQPKHSPAEGDREKHRGEAEKQLLDNNPVCFDDQLLPCCTHYYWSFGWSAGSAHSD